uniref:U6-Eretoxin-Ek1y_1 n=1 Tax=Eresus cinnaberinus TaxID=175337 RepID=A0A2D0PCS4_ERECI
MILLVVCIAVAASENYCPEVKGECSLSYRINDCCSQNDCPSYAMCCKGLVATYVNIHQFPDKRSGY